MRRALTALILLAIVPLLLTQVVISVLWFNSRGALDRERNYLVALDVAQAFEDFVHDVNRQELAVGIAVQWLTSQSPEQISRYLQANARDLVAVRFVDLVDREGKVVNSTDPRNVGRRVDASSDWYQEIVAGRQGYVSDLLPARPANQPAFLIVRRIEDEKGAMLGISMAEIDANRLGVLFRHIEVTEGGMFGLTDRKGTLVYMAPEIELSDREFFPFDPVLRTAMSTGQPATDTFTSDVDHRRRLGTRIPIADTGWVAGSSKPTSVLLAPVIRTLSLLACLNVVVIGLSSLAAGLLGRQVLRSVRRLQTHAQAVARGNLGHHTEVTGIRELEDLADSFNRMGIGLQEARAAQEQANAVLESRVAERTAELRKANELLKSEISERTVVEARLRESEQKLRAIFDRTLQFVGLLTPDGILVDANRGALEVAGVDKSAVVGKPFVDTPWWQHSPVMRDKLRAALRTAAEGQPVRFQATHPARDGNLIHVEFSLTPVFDAGGKVVFLVPEGRDITERKRAEEELSTYRDHLEELVTQRTAELELANQYLETEVTQRKQAAETLEKTAEELVRSNRELEQFAYIASHDLQEPLRVISGYLQLLQRRYQGRFDADADQFIEYAVDGSKRMQQLIADLLEYSRVGRRGKEFQSTNLEEVLAESLRMLQRGMGETGAVVTHDPLPTVQGDRTQLTQLFQNLIGNGIKFRGESRPEIHVSARADGDRWVLSVRDNGIGIDRQYWDQVFVIFQRLHSRQKYSGTGIGLAICKRIVERHGGRIWLESHPGKGSTFYFTI